MRDKSLDYLKGIAMILVMFTHIIPWDTRRDMYDSFHIIQAVPIFVFIGAYLMSRKIKKSEHIFKDYFSKNNILALICTTLIPVFCYSFLYYVLRRPNIIEYIKGGLLAGPGSYYIVMYLQIWLLIPLVVLFHKHFFNIPIQIFIIIIIEIILFNLPLPSWMYRLAIIRHLMLVYLGVVFQMINTDSISLKDLLYKHLYNWKKFYFWMLSIISGFVLYLIVYKNLKNILLPIQWHWFSYATDMYTMLFIYLLLCLYYLFTRNRLTNIALDALGLIGKNSLYIYIFHMFIGTFLSNMAKSNLVLSIMIPLLLLELKPKLNSLKEG